MRNKVLFAALVFVTGSFLLGEVVLAAEPAAVKGPRLGDKFSIKKDTKMGVLVNPYKLAPLTAIILDGGYKLSDATVTVQGKPGGGVPITYKVKNTSLWTHGGIPVFGMYPDYLNTVTVEYTLDGKRVKEDYKIRTAGIRVNTIQDQTESLPTVKPITVKPGFEDRLYLFNHLFFATNGGQFKWAKPGGALEWDWESVNWIADTKGEVRWYMDSDQLHNPNNKSNLGAMMGFRQTKDGKLGWVMSQSYMKYDLLGRPAWKHDLPNKFSDASHALQETSKGTYLVKASAADYLRKDGQRVHTVRDQIIEVNADGDVLDYWDLASILDPYRDTLLKAMDQGAVCLNVDESKIGQTAKEELEDVNAPFGDIPGVGPGRNWAHNNSMYYDPSDDSIIASVRHQGVVKIGRDKKVKWILSAPEGWTGELAAKVLKPVDAKGNPIKCSNGKCENTTFDWPWMQHTAWLTPKGTLTVFDNGDARGFEQPAIPTMKYSRAVEYKIDEKNMTVQQTWEFGKERGYNWYSPITSIVEYKQDKKTMFIYSATAGLFNPSQLTKTYLHEIKDGTQEMQVELEVQSNMKKMIGYQAMVIDPSIAF